MGTATERITESYLSSISINIALHGEPSEPAKFSGAAFNKLFLFTSH